MSKDKGRPPANPRAGGCRGRRQQTPASRRLTEPHRECPEQKRRRPPRGAAPGSGPAPSRRGAPSARVAARLRWQHSRLWQGAAVPASGLPPPSALAGGRRARGGTGPGVPLAGSLQPGGERRGEGRRARAERRLYPPGGADPHRSRPGENAARSRGEGRHACGGHLRGGEPRSCRRSSSRGARPGGRRCVLGSAGCWRSLVRQRRASPSFAALERFLSALATFAVRTGGERGLAVVLADFSEYVPSMRRALPHVRCWGGCLKWLLLWEAFSPLRSEHLIYLFLST